MTETNDNDSGPPTDSVLNASDGGGGIDLGDSPVEAPSRNPRVGAFEQTSSQGGPRDSPEKEPPSHNPRVGAFEETPSQGRSSDGKRSERTKLLAMASSTRTEIRLSEQSQQGGSEGTKRSGDDLPGRNRKQKNSRAQTASNNHQKDEQSVKNILKAERVEDIETAAEQKAREALEENERLQRELEEAQREKQVIKNAPTAIAIAAPPSEEQNDMGEDEEEKGCRNHWKVIAALALVAIAAIAIYFATRSPEVITPAPTTSPPTGEPSGSPSGLPTSTGYPTHFPSVLPTQSPSFARKTAVDMILGDIPVPRHREAYEWITEDDTWREHEVSTDPESEDRDAWITRYVMAILYFETDGPYWGVDRNWLDPVSVCDWERKDEYQNRPICEGDVITSLYLLGNGLSSRNDRIPKEISLLTNLNEINMEGNVLVGTIPEEYCALTKLERFDMSNNKISGTIPSCFDRLTSLEWFDMEVNLLTGTIPPSVTALSNLTRFDVSHNMLTGPIPRDIGRWTSLSKLDVESNQLTGSIPTSIGALTKLLSLDLGPNRLSSTIPTEIGMLLELEKLDLEDMLLTGSVPSEIGRLHKLVELSFQNNSFTGSLPLEISNLTKLDRKSAFEYIVWDAVGGKFHSQTLNWIFNVDKWGKPDNANQTQEHKDIWANRYALAALYYQTCTTDACKSKTEWPARYY